MLHLAVIFIHNDWKVFSKNEIFNMSGLELIFAKAGKGYENDFFPL